MSPRGRLALLAAIALGLAACGASPRGASAPNSSPARVSSDSLLQSIEAKVRAHDYSAQNDARGLGDGAFPLLARLATDRDPDARSLALLCLESAGGSRGGRVLGAALNDSSADVRMVASQALGRRPFPDALPYLLSAVRTSADPAIRRNCALAAGMIPGASASKLRESSRAEKDPDVQMALVQARARLGDGEARREFQAGLTSAQGQVRVLWLERCRYVGEPWVLSPLAPWLDDTHPAVRIGADGLPGPQYLRVCDVVINLAAELGKPRWSFKTGPAKNYSEEERKEARRVLGSIR